VALPKARIPLHLKSLWIAAIQMERVWGFARQAVVLSRQELELRPNHSIEERMEAARRDTLRDALELAIRVAYSIPFTKSGKVSDESLSMLPSQYLKILSEEERILHSTIVKERKQKFAHADPEHFFSEIQIAEGGWSHYQVTPDYFNPDQLDEIVKVSNKLRLHFRAEYQRLAKELKPGTY
jgi:hypothetical protein